jgi:hypothetical protein
MTTMARSFVTTVTLLVLVSSAQARSLTEVHLKPNQPTEAQVLALFKTWNAALATLDPAKVSGWQCTSNAVNAPRVMMPTGGPGGCQCMTQL